MLRFAPGAVSTRLRDGTYAAGFRGRDRTGLNFLLPFTVHDRKVTTALAVEGRFVWTQARLDAETVGGAAITLSRRFGLSRPWPAGVAQADQGSLAT